MIKLVYNIKDSLRCYQNNLMTTLLTYHEGLLIFSSKVVPIGQATLVQLQQSNDQNLW